MFGWRIESSSEDLISTVLLSLLALIKERGESRVTCVDHPKDSSSSPLTVVHAYQLWIICFVLLALQTITPGSTRILGPISEIVLRIRTFACSQRIRALGYAQQSEQLSCDLVSHNRRYCSTNSSVLPYQHAACTRVASDTDYV
nr:hypothetical protein CFP56_60739 [Quercus suber]